MTSGEDDESWLQLIRDVSPINKPQRELSTLKTRLKVTPKISPDRVYQGEQLKNLLIDNTDNIDANTARRFKKGEFGIDAELDLHGYTENQAYDAVIDFIKMAYLRQKRCVVIITGKGRHKSDIDDIIPSRAVLKDRVPQWLNLPEIRPLILAIAHPEHIEGGSGAIKILLRRKRL